MSANWQKATFLDICKKIFAGGDVPKENFSKEKTEKYTVPIFANGIKDKGLYGFTDIKKVEIPSITVSARGTIGYSEVRKEPFYPIVRLIVLIPDSEKVDINFLHYVIKGIDFKNSGTSIPQLTVPMIKKYEFFLPLLNEQKQIVEVLDKAFESIDKVKENIEKNIENTKELFQSKLNEIFSQKGEDWEEKKLYDLCDNGKKNIVDGPFGSNLKREHFIDDGISVLKIQNVKPFEILHKKMDYVSKEKYQELKRHSYQAGDIVMTKLGNPLGASAIVPENEFGLIVADLVRIRASKVNIEYLCYHLNSKVTQDIINSQQKGATRPRVKIVNVRDLPINVPSPKKQEDVIKEISLLEKNTNNLVKKYEKKLENLEELKKSILQKAFSGELI